MLGATMKISVETARATFIRFRLRCEQLEEFMVRYTESRGAPVL
jgi:hypothetical protein